MWLLSQYKLYCKIKKPFFKVLLFYSPGLVLRALFQGTEVIVSRAYVVCGFRCVVEKVPPDVQVPDFDWKPQHVIHELLCEQKNRYHSSSTMYFMMYTFSKNDGEGYR